MADPHPHNWTDCPQGEIAGLVETLKKARRRKTMQQAAGVTSVIVVLAFAATAVISGAFRDQTPAQSIACRRVLELAPQYVARQLDPDLTSQIDAHLGRCRSCRDRIHKQFPDFTPARAAEVELLVPCPTTVQAGSGRGLLALVAYQSDR